jgi:hypothetical protein
LKKAFDAEAQAAHMAEVMGLTIDPAWMPAVVTHLQTTAAIAAELMEFPLDDTVEFAPVFEP